MQDSWFPGYAWTILYCRVCGHHLGWHFTSSSAQRSQSNNATANPAMQLSQLLSAAGGAVLSRRLLESLLALTHPGNADISADDASHSASESSEYETVDDSEEGDAAYSSNEFNEVVDDSRIDDNQIDHSNYQETETVIVSSSSSSNGSERGSREVRVDQTGSV